MHYVYFLKSEVAAKSYVGETADQPDQRTAEHNAGRSAYTSQYKPWRLVSYLAVPHRSQALELEKYFKTGSGRAFLGKYILS